MKENKQKKGRFAWITQIFDFGQSYSLEGKDKHKLIYNSIFAPLMICHLFLIAITSILAYSNVIDVQISPLFPITQIEGVSFFLVFSTIPVFLYICAFLLFRYDIRVPKEEEKNLIEEQDHLKLILFLTFLAVIIQFIILLFFYL